LPLQRIGIRSCTIKAWPQLKDAELALNDADAFWAGQIDRIHWDKKPSIISETTPEMQCGTRWFSDGQLNLSYNMLDRHILAGRGEQACVIYDSPISGSKRTIKYNEMLDLVEKTAGALSNLGVGQGDNVLLYMPMIPEAIISVLACVRLGAAHSVVFGGFAAAELAKRIEEFTPKVVISASCGLEPGRTIAYKPLLDKAIELTPPECRPQNCMIYQRAGYDPATFVPGRDLDFMQCVNQASNAKPNIVPSDQLLYTLYTSGSTGKPKGVMRDCGGYAVALSYIMDEMFNCRAGDVVFSASDIGWVVGHSFIIYAPLLQGCTTICFEGKPIGTPDAGVFWRIVEEYGVKMIFTAPTAARAIRKEDPEMALRKKYDISSLEGVFMAGERMDPTTLIWLEENLKGVHIVDHWWQTETGWPITGRFTKNEPVPPQVLGSAGLANPGYDVKVVKPLADEDAVGGVAVEVPRGEMGEVLIKLPLPPGTMQGLYQNPDRFTKSYYDRFPGWYHSGDEGKMDENGYLHIMSRVDDVINTAGHRLSTSGMEEVLLTHPAVAECAVIGVKDELKGEIPVGSVVCKAGFEMDAKALEKELIKVIREQIGAVAAFKKCFVVQKLPKTRSGKIIRRSMKEIYNTGEYKAIPATIEDADALDHFVEVCKAY